MNALNRILKVLPGPFALWVGQWLNMFSGTNLTYPAWQTEAENTALALGTVVAILVGVIFRKSSQASLRKLTILSLVVTFAFISGCWWIRICLGKPMPASSATYLQDAWEYLYILAMVQLVATISMGVLSLGETKRNIVWIVLSVIALAIVLILIYFGWN